MRCTSNNCLSTLAVATACLALLAGGCANQVPTGTPLAQWSPERNAAILRKQREERSPEIAVWLAFSGGGSRAAALSYGVLEELYDTEIPAPGGPRPLVREVDVISSVSGGSFTAAYFALHGERIFTDFEERFLRQDVQGALLRRTLSPGNWTRLASPTFGRADLAAEYYDEILFDGATLADLERPGAPRVVINATDLATGVRIPFIREMFDFFCVDSGAYPVSRAVAASSAVPLVFSPIAIRNRAGSCGYPVPAWVREALDEETLSERSIAAWDVTSYLDPDLQPWLHLVDGGITDNLGLRSYYRTLALTRELGEDSPLLPPQEARNVLVILVNASAHAHREWALEQDSPPFLEMVRSASGGQIAGRNDDTIILTRRKFESWAREQSSPGRPVTFHFVEVSFDHVQDPRERAFLDDIDTNLRLSDEEVERLIEAGRKVLAESPAFRDFLRQVRARSLPR